MLKYATLLSLCLGLVTTGLLRMPAWRETAGYSRFVFDAAKLKRQGKYLDGQFQARFHFKAIENEILGMLAQGDVSLIQACDQLYYHACTVYPRFLRILKDPKIPLKEKMARTFIEFFYLEAETTPSCGEVARRLEQQLAARVFREWCQIPWPEEFTGGTP
jgi:hypothetical protein